MVYSSSGFLIRRLFKAHRASQTFCHLFYATIGFNYRSEPLATIFERARHLFKNQDELADALDRMHQKGGIHSHMRDGQQRYANVPLVIGMFETRINKMTPAFVEDFNQYTGEPKFGLEFLATDLPQLRTIPVSKSIEARHRTSTFDEVMALLDIAVLISTLSPHWFVGCYRCV